MGAEEKWLAVQRAGKAEAREGDTRCRACGGEGMKMLVLGARALNDTVPVTRVRVCEPCARKWLARDPEVVEKLEKEWRDV